MCRMQIALGRFFAAKFRSGVLYAIHAKSGDRAALEEALRLYRKARAAWAGMKKDASAYAADLSVSDRFDERGQWNDRVALIDEDIAEMEGGLASAKATEDDKVKAAVALSTGRAKRSVANCRHLPPARFKRKEALPVRIAPLTKVKSVRLYYRHVNQAERFESAEMTVQGGVYHATIPAAYTDSVYPLQYYFEVRELAEKVWLYPGFTAELANQPYFVVRRG